MAKSIRMWRQGGVVILLVATMTLATGCMHYRAIPMAQVRANPGMLMGRTIRATDSHATKEIEVRLVRDPVVSGKGRFTDPSAVDLRSVRHLEIRALNKGKVVVVLASSTIGMIALTFAVAFLTGFRAP